MRISAINTQYNQKNNIYNENKTTFKQGSIILNDKAGYIEKIAKNKNFTMDFIPSLLETFKKINDSIFDCLLHEGKDFGTATLMSDYYPNGLLSTEHRYVPLGTYQTENGPVELMSFTDDYCDENEYGGTVIYTNKLDRDNTPLEELPQLVEAALEFQKQEREYIDKKNLLEQGFSEIKFTA